LLEEDKQQLTLDLIKKANDNDVKLILPVDTVIADEFKNEANKKTVEPGRSPMAGWVWISGLNPSNFFRK
jgi:phosphoglycerate kinase